MEYLSEVLKILDGALKANASMAANYAGLLADKLEQDGQRPQANMVRERLTRAPLALAMAQDSGRGVSLGKLPVDHDSRLNTVDISHPEVNQIELILPDAIQQQLCDFLEGVKHHDELSSVGIDIPNRVIIYGPPGTGKTQTARWIAATLGLPLLTTRCDTLVSSLLGQTSRNLRQVFDYAQQMPCVLFLDEFDALAGARGNERDVGELQRVVIALLQNMDALPTTTVLVAATNHDQLLDPAVWRRFYTHIPMPLPNHGMLRALYASLLGSFVCEGLDLDELAFKSQGATGAAIEQVCMNAKRAAVMAGNDKISLAELYRFLGLALAMQSGQRLITKEQEIRWLRSWAPEIFALRALCALYGMTMHRMNQIVKQGTTKNGEKTNIRPQRKQK